MPLNGKKSSGPKIAALLAVLLLAACAGGQQNYTGPLTPQSGLCDPPSRVTLVNVNGAIQFVPNEGAFILAGRMAPDGSFAAIFQPPTHTENTHGEPPKTAPQVFRAAGRPATNGNLTGFYQTPRCTYAFTLTPAP